MAKRFNLVGYVVIGISLVILLTLIGGCTVSGQSKERAAERERYLARQEFVLAGELRVYLDGVGYENSGINITHMTDAEGRRSYSVLIHHRDITGMDKCGQQELARQLQQLIDDDQSMGDYEGTLSFF